MTKNEAIQDSMAANRRIARLESDLSAARAEAKRYREALEKVNRFELHEGDLRLLMISLKAGGLSEVDNAYATEYGLMRKAVRDALSPSAETGGQEVGG